VTNNAHKVRHPYTCRQGTAGLVLKWNFAKGN
jgi:hypothetical protein